MKGRTRKFAIAVIKFARTLPRDPVTDVIVRQLVKSSSSVGANYRASCRARSKPDFIAKLGIVEEESDESLFWLEVLVEAGMVKAEAVAKLLDEAEQLVRIIVAAINTARGGHRS